MSTGRSRAESRGPTAGERSKGPRLTSGCPSRCTPARPAAAPRSSPAAPACAGGADAAGRQFRALGLSPGWGGGGCPAWTTGGGAGVSDGRRPGSLPGAPRSYGARPLAGGRAGGGRRPGGGAPAHLVRHGPPSRPEPPSPAGEPPAPTHPQLLVTLTPSLATSLVRLGGTRLAVARSKPCSTTALHLLGQVLPVRRHPSSVQPHQHFAGAPSSPKLALSHLHLNLRSSRAAAVDRERRLGAWRALAPPAGAGGGKLAGRRRRRGAGPRPPDAALAGAI